MSTTETVTELERLPAFNETKTNILTLINAHLTLPEIAAALGLDPLQVRSEVGNMRQRLRRLLDEDTARGSRRCCPTCDRPLTK